jgi:hypothetical protein
MFGVVGRALLRDALVPAGWTLAAACGLAAVVAGVRALWSEGVVVDPVTWLLVVVYAVPPMASVALPAAGAVGVVAALSRWSDEGAWGGVRASGTNGRRLVPAVVALGLVLVALTSLVTMVAEPAARRATARQLAVAAEGVSLWPGAHAELGALSARPEGASADWAERVWFGAPGLVATAGQARVVRGPEDRLAVEMIDGVVLVDAGVPVRMTFEHGFRELAPASTPRLELDQRTWSELVAVASRTERSGRDASYEWSILYKRVLHPWVALLLPLALLPAATGRRPMLSVGAAAVGYLVAVRVGDQLAPGIGAPLAAAFGPAFVCAWSVVAWARWEDA